MYELIQLTERTYYIKSPTNIGLFRLDEKNVCLIDSGNDKDAGRRIRQVLDANGWQLTAIYNTHANADHIGGNRYLQGQTGCRIYAPGIDCAFTRHPVLEPSFLYGGYPPKDLRHKFLLAQESDAAELTADKLPEGFASIPLPGHFFDMVGFRTPDVSGGLPFQPGDTGQVPDRLYLRRGRVPENAGAGAGHDGEGICARAHGGDGGHRRSGAVQYPKGA